MARLQNRQISSNNGSVVGWYPNRSTSTCARELCIRVCVWDSEYPREL